MESEHAEQQEHRDTTCKIKVLKHQDDNNYLINMHVLHNTDLIREILPRSLTTPVPLFTDRYASEMW